MMPSQQHPYQTLPLPNDAPFILKPSGPSKGWGAFATRRISRGTVILRERPLFAIPKHHTAITPSDVLSALRTSTPTTQRQFQALRDHHATTPFQNPAKAFAENSFAIGGTTDTHSPAHGFFPLLSRFNHACLPNAAVPLIKDADAPALYATRDIAAGEEIAFSYDPHFESRTARERHASLGFACGCRACRPPGSRFQRASDLWRRLIRGLQFMVSGDDDGEERFHVIAEPEVRKQVAECRTPLSVLLVCNLLTQCLMEAEGILDDFEIGRLQPGATAMAKMLRRPENASIARFAMAQRTPSERLRVAFALYGRADEGDEEMAYTLRHIQGVS